MLVQEHSGTESELSPKRFGVVKQEIVRSYIFITNLYSRSIRWGMNLFGTRLRVALTEERGDVPGWVLVVLMTTGLVTGIWTVAAPRLSSILRSSLDSMNNVR